MEKLVYFEIRGKYARNIALAGVESLKVDISCQQSSYQTWPENIFLYDFKTQNYKHEQLTQSFVNWNKANNIYVSCCVYQCQYTGISKHGDIYSKLLCMKIIVFNEASILLCMKILFTSERLLNITWPFLKVHAL